MIRIDKDLDDIPESLKTDPNSISQDPARTTNMRREELIQLGQYPPSVSSSVYDSRYKMDDIKEKLMKIYHSKCAYCESSLEQLQVEHFRPKRGGYYWLTYSWDNLLLSCPICNSRKGSKFPVLLNKVVYDKTRDELDKINTLSKQYDLLESPVLINPETASTDLLATAVFDKQGGMSSVDMRMDETIKKCGLDRRALQQRRKKIWDDLQKDLRVAILESQGNKELLKPLLRVVLKSFINKMKDPEADYIAYRQFIVNAGWIKAVSLFKKP